MSQKYKVSVIIPIYNVAEYLEECLNSVVNQTIDSLEVIMVDDGSTDISGTIAKRYAERYENFFYYLKENGGLGNARNYGLQFVHGDYLIFLDSDDIVPENAYEVMYNKAIETGNDMVVGDVNRFDSKKVYNSVLHRKAFVDYYDKTSIIETPQLIYDSTSWNKLIKFSFWKQHDFKFPEKILYEDIPVTMPLHFYANAVSVVNQVVYLWRARDGANKSITQNRKEVKNFADRLTIMKMVDQFYDENVHDEYAHYMKDYKWLGVDLRIYIQELIDADEEYTNLVFKEIQEYFPSLRKDSFRDIPAIDRMKYYLVLNNQREKLLELLQYEKEHYKMLGVKKVNTPEGTRYIGKFPLAEFPEEYYDMTRELNLCNATRVVHKAEWNGSKLKLNGYCFIQKLTCEKKSSQKLSATLINLMTGNKVEIPLERCKAFGVHGKHGIKIDDVNKGITFFDYKWSGFNIEIDFSDKKIWDVIQNGLVKIELKYEREGIERTFYVGGPVKGKAPRPDFININGYSICPHYNLGYDLCIECNKIPFHLDAINIKDNKIVFGGYAEEKPELLLCAETISSLETIKKYDCRDGSYYELKIDNSKISEGTTYSIKSCNKENLLLSNWIKGKYYRFEEKILHVESNQEQGILLEVVETKPFIENIQVDGVRAQILIKLFQNVNLKNSKFGLYLQCIEEKLSTISLESTDIQKFEDYIEIKFIMDFSEQKFVKYLMQGKWILRLTYTDGESTYDTDIYGSEVNSLVQNVEGKTHNYLFGRADNRLNQEIITVKRIWKWYEKTKLRRKVIRGIIYPIFRLLPIKKKMVVFESRWGNEFRCNPRAFYEYMDKEHPEYTCVWSMKDERNPVEGNAIVVRRGSARYFYYMARAKYFVNNVNFEDAFEKRKNQVEIQTMHGTPLKTLGLDVPGDFPTKISIDKFLRKCNRWDYLVVQSDMVKNITSSCYAFDREFLETGYPRNDVLYQKNNENDIQKIKEKIGIPKQKKVILYAPTWRVRNQFELQINIEKAKKLIGEEYVLMLRVHPLAVKGLKQEIFDNDFIYNVTEYPYVEELYLVSDICITDYSSVMFDYAILNRPMLFYTYDLEDYRDTLRGFNFNFEAEAPGPLLKTSSEVIDAICNIEQISEKYDCDLQKFRNKFCQYERNNSSEEIYNIVMKNN